MRKNDMGSSSRNPEQNREGQSGSSSPQRIDIFRQMSESGKPREAQVGGCSNEQKIERTNQEINQKTEEKEMTLEQGIQKLLPPEVQEIIGKKALPMALAADFSKSYEHNFEHWRAIDMLEQKGDRFYAQKLFEQLDNDRLEHYTKLKMVFAIGKLGDQSLVPQLINKLFTDGNMKEGMYGAIVGAIVMLGGQQELVKEWDARHVDYEKISRNQRRNQQLVREKARMMWLTRLAMDGVAKVLCNPSVGQELVEENVASSEFRRPKAIVAGMFGDRGTAVALMLRSSNTMRTKMGKEFAWIGFTGQSVL